MALRSAGPPPLPPSELQRMKDQLSTHYGSEVFEEAGAKIIIIRVPNDHPDPVNDIENAIEYVQPGDVAGLTHCLLMGNRSTQAVYVQPLQQLMSHRIERDRTESQNLRAQLGEESFQIFRAQADPKQLPRLAIRLGQDTVADLEDGDLEWLVDAIGPELEAGRLNGVVAVHLIAAQDDVRVDADAFLADVKRRYQDEDRKRQRAEELRRLAEEAAAQQAAERKKIVDEMNQAMGRRTVSAPLRRMESTNWNESSVRNLRDEGTGSRHDRPTSRLEDPVTSRVDALVSGREQREPEATPLDELRAVLKKAGFALMERPEVDGHTLDLAAERDSGYPQRVIVRSCERLSFELAEELLGTSRALEVDMTLALAPHIDPEAQKRLIATKVKWVRPLDVPQLHL